MSQYIYDYYTVDVPEDFGTLEERADQAILQAQEQTRLYALPALWTAWAEEGTEAVKVRRKRRRSDA